MANYIVDFLENNNILYEHQYGFRKCHSTNHVVITLVERVAKALDTVLVSTVYIFPFQNGVYLAIYTCLFRWCYGHFYNRLTQFIVYCYSSYVVCTILLRRPVDLSTHWTVTAISLHVTTFVGVCHE